MTEQPAKPKSFPWKEIIITILSLLLLLLGFRSFQLHKQLESNQEKEIQLTSRINEQTLQIKHFEKLSREISTLCTPSPSDVIDPLAPCAQCISTVLGKTTSSAKSAIELGKYLVDIYQNHSNTLDYQKYKDELIKVAEQITHGETHLLYTSVQHLLDVKDRRIHELEAQQKSLEDQLTNTSNLQSELERCLSSSNFLIRRSGLDRPPCWAGEDGSVQYLFDLTLLPNEKVIVNPAWPESRAQEARSMAPVRKIEPYFNQEISLPFFLRQGQEIHAIGNRAQPEACRYFVRLRSKIEDRETADKSRLAVEDYFYKYEYRKE